MSFKEAQVKPGNAFPEQIAALAAGVAAVPQGLSAAGAISLVTRDTYLKVGATVGMAFTLADGVEGQEKFVVLTSKSGSGSAVVTLNVTGGTTITLDTAGEQALLRFLDGKWRVVTNTGVLA